MLAMALAAEPRLLIADEPTTALDVTTQRRILGVMDELAAKRNMAVLLITHNLGIVANYMQRLYVMYAGRIVESGPVRDVLSAPRHPYTQGLLAAVPSLRLDKPRLQDIPGTVPPPGRFPPGCAFAPRCPRATPACSEAVPPLVTEGPRAVPYVFHPFHLAEQMTDETTTCAALLHDVVEDTDMTLDDLARDFPPEVVEAVRLLTHTEDVDYFDYVRAIRGNPIATAVKLADLAHNSDSARAALTPGTPESRRHPRIPRRPPCQIRQGPCPPPRSTLKAPFARPLRGSESTWQGDGEEAGIIYRAFAVLYFLWTLLRLHLLLALLILPENKKLPIQRGTVWETI